MSEAARLLKAAKPSLLLRRFILLALHTGSRPGVILSLTWPQIDLDHGTMRRKILGHLRHWKRIDGPKSSPSYVGLGTVMGLNAESPA